MVLINIIILTYYHHNAFHNADLSIENADDSQVTTLDMSDNSKTYHIPTHNTLCTYAQQGYAFFTLSAYATGLSIWSRRFVYMYVAKKSTYLASALITIQKDSAECIIRNLKTFLKEIYQM